jgi:hypothetical protein
MTKNPFYNALGALTYITLIVSILRLVEHVAGNTPDNNFLAPIASISLLVLSVSVMAFIFFYNPLLLLIKGEQKQALGLFLKTVAIFAIFGFLVFALMLIVTV